MKVVDVLLHDDVAPACERRVLVTDHHRVKSDTAGRILGPVHEAEQVTLVEVLESVDLIDDRGHVAEPVHDLAGELETEIHLRSANMKQQITRSGHGSVLGAGDLAEGMQLRRACSGEQAVPGLRSHADHAGEPAVRDSESDGSLQPGTVAEQVTSGSFAAGVDGDHQKDRRAR